MNEMTNQKRLRLYLIRHGEVEGSADGKLLGWTDAPLSELGMEQSRQLAERLSNVHLSAIYSSDLHRARLMAETIADIGNLKVHENPAWREIDMRDWEGHTMASLHAEAPALVSRLFEDPASFEYPGGESFRAFTTRVQTALGHLLESHENDEVALVAHGGVCRTIVGTMMGMPTQNWLRLSQDYGCLDVMDWYGSHPVLRLLNDGYDFGTRAL